MQSNLRMSVRGALELRTALGGPSHPAVDVRETQVALAELAALRLDADLVSPERAARTEPYVAAYQARATRGDQLRLAPQARCSELKVQRAIDQLLASPALISPAPELAQADAALRSVLAAVRDARQEIRTPHQTRG